MPGQSWYRRNIVGHWKTLFAVLLVVIAANGAAIFFYLTQPDPWTPLGPYPIQDVTSPNADVSIASSNENATATQSVPVIVVTEGQPVPTVPVAATKCNSTTLSVDENGRTRWMNVQPPGFFSVEIFGTGTRQPGCTVTKYQNSIPDDVLAHIRNLAQTTGQDTTLWQIQGSETPIGKANPQTVYWQTENFALIYRSAS